jgi:hypothetical protein
LGADHGHDVAIAIIGGESVVGDFHVVDGGGWFVDGGDFFVCDHEQPTHATCALVGPANV